jgi:hypothetical protein
VVGEKARVSEPFLLRLATHKLIHGAFVLGNHVGTVFYFEDVEKGLAAFGALDSEGPSQVARFSLVKGPGGKGYTLN